MQFSRWKYVCKMLLRPAGFASDEVENSDSHYSWINRSRFMTHGLESKALLEMSGYEPADTHWVHATHDEVTITITIAGNVHALSENLQQS